MTDTRLLNRILREIASEISLKDTMRDRAVSGYQAVGNWLGEGLNYQVRIAPQGSMNLGTTIKPISDEDDYDIDLVCLLEDGQELTAEELKTMVGDRLKQHGLYSGMLEREGKRCWTLHYAQFHMDILPSVPRDNVYQEPGHTIIRLTHRNGEHDYEDRFSNPHGYRLWFESCMNTQMLLEQRQMIAKRKCIEIEKVPTYYLKTPLQQTIQLLKRHRDICFANNPDVAPISVIITTLAAKAYKGERSLYQAMNDLLPRMIDNIEIRQGEIWIPNPVMPEENYADKWAEHPERKTAFLKWIDQAYQDLVATPQNLVGLNRIYEHYGKVLGEAPVKRAYATIAESLRQARTQNRLYSTGLTSGLTALQESGGRAVPPHTFYGK